MILFFYLWYCKYGWAIGEFLIDLFLNFGLYFRQRICVTVYVTSSTYVCASVITCIAVHLSTFVYRQ